MGKEASTSYFAGGNTAQGFYSLFRYIPGSETKRLLIIKGGPGTGKSTLLKRLQAKALAAGLKTELFYCSSDPASLDGLSVPALGFAAVDGTAPTPWILLYLAHMMKLLILANAGKKRSCSPKDM